jgi:hypothetical protein
MSVLYGLLYMFFVAFLIIYQEGKGYTAGITGLMFIPLALGVVVSSCLSPLVNKHYLRMCAKHGPNPPAEFRLYPMLFSCCFAPIGLFIFACKIGRGSKHMEPFTNFTQGPHTPESFGLAPQLLDSLLD